MFRRPEFGILDWQSEHTTCSDRSTINFPWAIHNGGLHHRRAENSSRNRVDGDGAIVHVRHYFEIFDVSGADRFEPDGLPDAAGRGVPDPMRIADLLAARLSGGIGRVPHRNQQFIRTGESSGFSDVE